MGNDIRILTIFPNFFLSTYIVITGCKLFGILDEKVINLYITIGFFIIYIRELYLIYRNNKKYEKYENTLSVSKQL